MRHVLKGLATAAALMLSAAAQAGNPAPDEAGAMAFLKESKCLTCHSVDKKKDGPAYIEVAKKYRGKADAEAKLTLWVSKKHTVEIDGEEEEHGMVKTRDAGRISNLVRWILSH